MVSELEHRWRFYFSNSILWAAAIVASAIVGAPIILSGVILPALAVAFLLGNLSTSVQQKPTPKTS